MNTWQKVAIGVGAALLLGFAVGYVLGASGKGKAEDALASARRRANDAEASLKQQTDSCERRLAKSKLARRVVRAKEHMLWAVVELYANNYGRTSQHLARARREIKAAEDGLDSADAKLARALYDKMGAAQTLTMRLDPMARVEIDKILADLQRLPGAR